MIKSLPGEQVILLEKAFKGAKKRREIFRLQALLLLTQGYRREEVAGMVRVSLCALGNWVSKFKKHGVDGLCDKNQPGNHRKLTVLQKQELKTLITNQTPDQLNLEDKFWTPKLVSQLIRSKYQISYLQEASRRLLHQFGLSFHKPKKVNQRQSEHMKVRFEETLKKDSRTGLTEKIRWSW